ncbi:LOW QUALITY PROTEIN: hypothetical protein BDA96_01G521400, partial [Sorghum bicolor]
AEVLLLFRSFLRTAKQFSDYNICEYTDTRRRAADAFRENRVLADAPTAAARREEAAARGREAASGTAVVYPLYAPKAKSAMELKVQ